MLFKSSTTAPSPTARCYKPQTISTVRAIGRLIMPRQNAAGEIQQRDSSAAPPAKTDPLGGLTLTVGRMRWGFLCLLLVLCGRHRALAQGGYTITDLGVSGEWYSEAHGLNNGGRAVGEYEPAGALYQHGFLYDGQTTADLNILPNVYTIAWGINDSNIVVGEYLPQPNTFSFIIEAFKYSNGGATGLGYLSSSSYSSAHAINRLGQIVGESSTNSTGSVIHAVLWNTNSTKVDLGVLSGNYSSANAINNSGIIVGESSVEGSTNTHAFIYTNSIVPLGTLSGGDYSSAKGINDAGVVVGESTEISGGAPNLQAFVYRNGSMTSLRAQAAALGADSSSSSAINNLGQIVGYLGYGQLGVAFMFDGTNMVNLNQYIPASSGFTNLASADGINDKGQIIGSGTLTNGDYHGFLLTPVSKPWILLSALAQPSGSGFQMTIKGLPGEQFIVQASTDLSSTSNWVSLHTNVLTGSQTNYTDPDATNCKARYYRALLLQ